VTVARLRTVAMSEWRHILKFCIVGGMGYIVNLAVFYALMHWGAMHYLAASTVSYFVAWAFNFFLNRQWTFQKHNDAVAPQAAKYFVASALGWCVNEIVLVALVHGGVAHLLAQAIGIAASTPVTFLVTRGWAFR
jgi:putative flippase GtrA